MKRMIKSTDRSIENLIDDIENKIDKLDVESSEEMYTDCNGNDIDNYNSSLYNVVRRV